MAEFRVRLLDLDGPERARTELERVGADPAGVARMLGKAEFLAFHAAGVRAPGANILKQEMLSLGGEAAVGRGVVNCSLDRTDVVLLGTRKQLRGLLKKLRPQPFGLPRLADELAAALAALDRRFILSFPGGSLDLSSGPRVMGIVNATPDSFSDGGDCLEVEAAVDRALSLVDQGADLLDLGGESSRPGADPVSEEQETARVLPVLERLAGRVGVPISIDTYRSSVARRALDAGASVVNDISGLTADPNMAREVAASGAGVVLMHMRGTPKTMQTDLSYADLLAEVWRALDERASLARAAGVGPDRIVVDPGIGFAKSTGGNLLLLRRLGELRTLGYPILVGASRKAFIGKVLGIERPKDRLEGALAAAVMAVSNGAHIVRAHDVRETRRAVDLAWAIRSAQEE